jgi:hypothetical protein
MARHVQFGLVIGHKRITGEIQFEAKITNMGTMRNSDV